MNFSYDITDALAVSFEAINLTGEDFAPAQERKWPTGSSRNCIRATCSESLQVQLSSEC